MRLRERIFAVLCFGLLLVALLGCSSAGIASKSFEISGDVETNTTVEWTSEDSEN